MNLCEKINLPLPHETLSRVFYFRQKHADLIQNLVKGSWVLQVANPKMSNWQGKGGRELRNVISTIPGSDDLCIWLNCYLIHWDSNHIPTEM